MTNSEALKVTYPEWFDADIFRTRIEEVFKTFNLEVKTAKGFVPTTPDMKLASSDEYRITLGKEETKDGCVSDPENPLEPLVEEIRKILLQSIAKGDLSEEHKADRMKQLAKVLNSEYAGDFIANIAIVLHARMRIKLLPTS